MSEGLGANMKLTATELKDAMIVATEMNQPMMVWGPPGIAKSAIAMQVAKETGRHYIDVRCLLFDPVDLKGIPWRDEYNHTRWANPGFLPPSDSKERYLINLEELPGALPSVQMALYQLLDSRSRGIAEYKLPDGAAVIACGNNVEDKGVHYKFAPALRSRVVHVEMELDVQVWMEWAIQNGIRPEIVFFIQFRPDLLSTYEPKSNDKTFACPRTWEFVSNIMSNSKNGADKVRDALIVGAIGAPAAIEFLAFLEIWQDMVHPSEVINNPHGVAIPANVSAVIALCGALFATANEDNFAPIVEFAKRLRPELGYFLVRGAAMRNPKLRYTKSWQDYECESLAMA